MRGYVRVHGKYPQYFVLIHGMRAYLLSRDVFSRGVIDLRGIDLLGGVCWLDRAQAQAQAMPVGTGSGDAPTGI